LVEPKGKWLIILQCLSQDRMSMIFKEEKIEGRVITAVPQGRGGRSYYLDALRTYAAFAIVTVHVAAWIGRTMTPLTSVNWWVAN
jgi:hypothetical protein